MKEKSNYKTACILIDENDFVAFKGLYKEVLPKEFCWFPITFLPMMQLMWQEVEKNYFLPRISEKVDCSILTQRLYGESQKFLKELCLNNKVVDNASEGSFPLEYFWLSIWVATHRIISFCNDLLNQCPVEEVILIQRNRVLNDGGLLLEMASFSSLVRDFFESKGVKTRCLNRGDLRKKPRTIFYNQRSDLNPFLHTLKFIYWKVLSFNRKDHDCILVRPGYDNKINYNRVYSSRSLFPQVFHGGRMPYLHSWSKLFRFLITRSFLKKSSSDCTTSVTKPYRCKFFDFEFDFAERFHNTIVQYLNDTMWMQDYVDLFWHTCLDSQKQYLMIFSLAPVHLSSYFLIKKTKEANGKIAVWQHGGFYGYSSHFLQHVSDYKAADYFLSFGRNDSNGIAGSKEDSSFVCVQVGSNMFNRKLVRDGSEVNSLPTSKKGLFIPAVIGNFYSQGRVKWNSVLQFEATRQIIDFFGSNTETELVVKGLKGHQAHLELSRYIKEKGYGSVSYSDILINKALVSNYDFVILDNPSTVLLQVLKQYVGPVFLMVNQESWSIGEDALILLKERVVYSQTIDELKSQLADFLKTESLEGVDVRARGFIDTYVRQFSYTEYERFVQGEINVSSR